jgi:hypothetical protein
MKVQLLKQEIRKLKGILAYKLEDSIRNKHQYELDMLLEQLQKEVNRLHDKQFQIIDLLAYDKGETITIAERIIIAQYRAKLFRLVDYCMDLIGVDEVPNHKLSQIIKDKLQILEKQLKYEL